MVQDLGLLLAVLGSKLRLVVPSFVHSVGYSAQASMQSKQAHTILPAELEGK
jgi:hypothetical protein